LSGYVSTHLIAQFRELVITMTDLNPQAKQMADQSMVRTLDGQARAIWPQEMQVGASLCDSVQCPNTRCWLWYWRNGVFGIRAAMNLQEITIDYVVVDTLRVPRETFATILEAWRDGLCGVDRQANADHPGVSGDGLRSNDRQYPQPARVRGVDGASGKR
jgi:hypothetical protein